MSLYSKFLGFAIQWDQDWETLRAEGDETALQGAREIENVLGERSCAIVYHIERALRDARCLNLTGDRTIKHSAIRLKKDASEALEIYMDTSLFADIMYDPKDFYELPIDHQVIGEAWINCIEQGLSVLSTYPGYPTEVIRAACDAFRENDYTLKLFSPKPTTINGTKLKGRVDTYIDAISLRRNLTISYRGKELLAKEISHFNRIDVANAANHHFIELNDRTLTFRPLEQEEYDWWLNMSGPYAIRDPVDLNLNDFPDVLQFIIEKGWTS